MNRDLKRLIFRISARDVENCVKESPRQTDFEEIGCKRWIQTRIINDVIYSAAHTPLIKSIARIFRVLIELASSSALCYRSLIIICIKPNSIYLQRRKVDFCRICHSMPKILSSSNYPTLSSIKILRCNYKRLLPTMA